MPDLQIIPRDLRIQVKNLDRYPREDQAQLLQKLALDFYLRKGSVPPQLIELQKLVAAAKPGFKFNPYHDELGRFTFAPDGGEGDEADDDGDSEDDGDSASDRIGNFLQWALGIATAHAQEADVKPEENEPAAEEDILGDIKIGYYQDGLTTLRQLDPNNRDFDSISGPDWIPSDDDINRLNEAISTASQQRVMDFAMPDGQPVGESGRSGDTRIISADLEQAQKDFEFLTVGGTVRVAPTYKGVLMNLPGGYGIIGLRPESTSGSPSLDFNVPGVTFRQIHYE